MFCVGRMADYRLSAQVISRSSGQSAVAAAAYRAGERLHDVRLGEAHDYRRKSGVLHSQIMAPANTPDWMKDRAQLWNAVEAAEKRKDAQLAREIQLSLPHELDHKARVELARRFVQEQFVDRGMIADLAIHTPGREGDDRNHHAHVMLTMRELTGEGFGKKAREWNGPDVLEGWREQWANHQNREFEKRGLDIRVDHRSYEAQGIDREPTQHLGPTASKMERRGSEIPDRRGEPPPDFCERQSPGSRGGSLPPGTADCIREKAVRGMGTAQARGPEIRAAAFKSGPVAQSGSPASAARWRAGQNLRTAQRRAEAAGRSARRTAEISAACGDCCARSPGRRRPTARAGQPSTRPLAISRSARTSSAKPSRPSWKGSRAGPDSTNKSRPRPWSAV